MKLLLFTFSILLSASCVASEARPVSGINAFSGVDTEMSFLVRTASVVIADYKLIKRDFHYTKDLTNSEIDYWLVSEAAFMTREQLVTNNINSRIKIDHGTFKSVFRPKEYRRASIIPVSNPYRQEVPELPAHYIDVKGSGSKNPALATHANGLASVPEVLREFFLEKQISEIFKVHHPELRTVGSYAVIDLGFNFKCHALPFLCFRSGLLLRQAHHRQYSRHEGDNPTMPSVLNKEKQLEYELALRRFGITTSSDRSSQIINVQGSTKGALVDFGGMSVRRHFTGPIYSYYEGDDHNGQVLLMNETDSHYPQPDPKLALSSITWGIPPLLPRAGKTHLNFLALVLISRPSTSAGKIRKKIDRYFTKVFRSYSKPDDCSKFLR